MSLTGGKRKLSKWNKFVQKVYADQHRKNKNFQFKDALKMASAMKKKGQYGGNDDVNMSDDVVVKMDNMSDAVDDKMDDAVDVKMDDAVDVKMDDAVDVDMTGGRRRRTMRRRKGRTMRGKRRTMRRSQKRGRALRGGFIVV